MKKLILLLMCISLLKTGISQTNVSGTITSNTNWALAGSPYNITGDVQIPTGVTLSLAAGVQVVFKGDYEIRVWGGSVVSKGTVLSPIHFSGDLVGKAMLMFKSSDLGNSVLLHVNFKGPKNALQLAAELPGAEDPVKNSDTLSIDSSSFANTIIQTQGIYTKALLLIKNTNISSTTLNSINSESEGIFLDHCKLASCKINSNARDYPTLNILSSSVLNTSFIVESAKIHNSTIQESTFSDATNFVQNIDLLNSVLINTPMDIPRTQLTMNNCVYNYNSPIGIRFGLGSIYCSELTGNNQGTALNLVRWDDGIFIGSFGFMNNTFRNNKIAIEIASDIPRSLRLDTNNFINNSLYHIKNLSGSTPASANYCFWDATDSTSIAAKMYDHADDPSVAFIYFANFLKAPYHSAACPPLPIFTSIKEYKHKANTAFDVTLYPNPASSTVYLKLDHTAAMGLSAQIEILNVTGQVVYSKQFVPSSTDQFIDVSGFSKGIYFCKVRIGQDTAIKKFIVQ